jgi:sialate O-acetylesterase
MKHRFVADLTVLDPKEILMRCQRLVRILACCVLVAFSAAAAVASVKLPSVIGDNMVLQRGQPVPIWGWANKGDEVTVSIAGQMQSAKAGDDGRWKVVLEQLDVGQPLEMTIKGSSDALIALKNILVGEVWVCSGQSNMEMEVAKCNDASREIAAANYPNLRLFTVEFKMSAEPQVDCTGNWEPCSPANVAGFSAAAYYFGRQLQKELGVPIGLIHTSTGGTPAELWTSRKTLETDPVLKPLAKGESSCLYNAMIAPLIPYAIRGAIWYQGESNVVRAHQYRTLFPAMIANWRADWGLGDFPFGFVQIAPYRYDGLSPTACAELWEAQLMTLKASPNTGMAVTMDIGDVKDVHPTNKQDVGKRLSLWAMAKVYGRDLVYSGPIYKSMSVEGSKVRLEFDHVGGGLAAADGKPLREFALAGADQKFVLADAEIDGNTVVCHSDQVAQPVSVSYAWRDDAVPNLANKEGLPASPFRTDSWKRVTEGKMEGK